MRKFSPAQWKTVRDAFRGLLSHPTEQRARELETLTLNEVEREAVRELLHSHGELKQSHRFDPGFATLPLDQEDPDDTNLGREVGHYRLLRRIGEGGMGVVYLAEQQHPRRHVALKLIRPDRSSPSLLRRLQIEAEVLGRLKHHAIAQIYESGVAKTAQGREQPYIVMEFVDGPSLADYLAASHLKERKKIELLAAIADGVSHAHQKGVIHRDLKPGNILMMREGEPKIVDFGIARIIDSDVGLETRPTDEGDVIGTLAYMSPEQVTGRLSEVDTRTDVYALGVIGYELVVGHRPIDVAEKTVIDAIQIVAEGVTDTLRKTHRELRNDLGIIIFRAMAREPELRYPSAAEFALDLRRYLAGEAVAARPPSVMYHIRVFARRHKAFMASSALIALILLIATVLSVRSAIVANRAKELAAGESAKLSAVNRFFLDEMMGQANPEIALGRDITIREAVDRASDRIDNIDQPDVRSAVQRAISGIYLSIGTSGKRNTGQNLYETALFHAREALNTRRQIHDEPHEAIAESRENVGSCLLKLSRYSKAEEEVRKALDARQELHPPGDERVAKAELSLVTLLMLQGKLDVTPHVYLNCLPTAQRCDKRALFGLQELVLL